MKKILLIAAFFITTGVFTSCSKENDVTPTKIDKKVADGDGETGDGRLGTGDGGIDRPPVKKPSSN